MKAGEVVYMDYGSDWEYYNSDITRTWPVSGKFSAEQEKMYRCVLEARDAIIAAMKPGASINSLQDVAQAVYEKHGYKDDFLALGRYIGHFVGLGHSALGETEVRPEGGRRVFASGAVMFPVSLGRGVTKDRELQPDDIAGVSDLYPDGDFSDTSGALSGRVTLNGTGVIGAHVVAFNPRTGALIGVGEHRRPPPR